MSNRRKPKGAVASYEARTPAVRLLQTAMAGNNDALRRQVLRCTAGLADDELRNLILVLAGAGGVFANRVPEPHRSELAWQLDNPRQALGVAMREAMEATP